MAGTTQRNFPLTHDQAEWLRETAHTYRVKQAEIVRYGIESVRADLEGRPRPPSPIRAATRRSPLGGSLSDGPDLAAGLLEDRRREEPR